jgi:TatD DNase family protein
VLVNIHTHRPVTQSDTIHVTNFDHPNSTPPVGFYSLGIHPWWVNHISWSEFEQKVKIAASDANFVAWGELGLDRVKKETWDLQIEVLQKTIALLSLKPQPIIIHCVQAYEEMIEMLVKKTKLPIIFHHYQGNDEITNKLLRFSHVFFSINPKSFEKRLDNYLKLIPITRLFLETDALDANIREVYERFANQAELSLEEVTQQIYRNFTSIFNSKTV